MGGVGDECTNFVPMTPFFPPTHSRCCSELNRKCKKIYLPHPPPPACAARRRAPPTGPVEPPVAELSAIHRVGSATPEPSRHRDRCQPESVARCQPMSAATRIWASGHRCRPHVHRRRPPVTEGFCFKFSLNLF
jgi:hypothetical protein